MGAKNDKLASTNRLPPTPTRDNFPIQSNPKFQANNSPLNQSANDLIQNNQNGFYNNNSNKNNNNSLQTNQALYEEMLRNQQFRPKQINPNKVDYEYDDYDYDERINYRDPFNKVIHITDNPTRNELPRPKVLPLTPIEIMEYKRNGLFFPPFRPYEEHVYQRPHMYYSEPNENEYVYSNEPEFAGMHRGYQAPKRSKNPNAVEDCYTITSNEAQKVKRLFDLNSNRNIMNFEQFYNLYGQTYSTAQRAFYQMDRDMDGLINYDEFLLGYCRQRPQQGMYHEAYKPLRKYDIVYPQPSGARKNEPNKVCETLSLPFGPLDEIDPATMPIENLAANLKPFYYNY